MLVAAIMPRMGMQRFAVILFIYFSTCIRGQNYAQRGFLNNQDVRTPGNDDLSTEDYDFGEDDPDVWPWNVEQFPHPRINPPFCNRLGPSNVCDPDSMLTKKQADDLDVIIQRLVTETPCICDDCDGPSAGGIQVGIAVLKHTFHPYNEHPSKIIRSFSEKLRQNWKLGDCENDILVVVATNDRQSYTDVGRATSNYISLEEAYRIFLENKAHFTAGHYYEGLQAMLRDYYEAARTIRRPTEDAQMDVGLVSGLVVGIIFLIGVIIIVVVLVFKRIKKSRSEKDSRRNRRDDVSSSWQRKDNVSISFPISSSQYQPCNTEDDVTGSNTKEDDEVINTQLQTVTPEEDSKETVQLNSGDPGNKTNDATVHSPEEPPSGDTEMIYDRPKLLTFVPKKDYTGDMTDL